MPSHHTVYGLRICSNRPIPGFLLDAPRAEVDVTIELRDTVPEDGADLYSGLEACYSSPAFDRPGRPTVQVWKRPKVGFHFVYDDDTRIEVSEAADRIEAHSPPGASLEDTAYYVAGPALGFVLRLRSVTGIHASAVVWRKGAVLFVGSVGAGKSTMAAAMSRFGCPVITEDIAALSERKGRFGVRKGYPRVNLWPESVSALFGSHDALPEIAPPWPKRYLALDAAAFRSIDSPVPIRAIYLLAERTENSVPKASEMTPSEALLALIGNTYMNYLPGMEHQQRNFDALARLSSRIPVRRLSLPEGDIDTTCAAVLDDLDRLSG